jgi:drug/metabolite transporter (DMT)-like permease
VQLWLIYVIVVLVSWGVLGIFQKVASSYISAESMLIWLIVGFLLFQPFVYPSKPLSIYSTKHIWYGLLSGLLSNVGAWGLFEAMKVGGKASIVSPFCALYPLPVVFLAPFVFHEKVTLIQAVGVVCALIAVVLLSREAEPAASSVTAEPVASGGE